MFSEQEYNRKTLYLLRQLSDVKYRQKYIERHRKKMNTELQKKYQILQEELRRQGSVAVAFSGGADSALLLFAAAQTLKERAAAVTVRMDSVPKREIEEAAAFCEKYGIAQYFCDVNVFEIDGFAKNDRDRCYCCKRSIFSEILAKAEELGFQTVADGTNTDDLEEDRPGMRAIRELGVISPLQRAGLAKAEIRELSGEFGLPTSDKPSAACLASRIACGETITREKLAMTEKAEELLWNLGFHQVRVRMHGTIARIEVPQKEMERLLAAETRDSLSAALHSLGFVYVTMDLDGFRSGSMNEVFRNRQMEKG